MSTSSAKDVAKFIATIAPHFPKALKAGDEQAEAMWTTTLVAAYCQMSFYEKNALKSVDNAYVKNA